MRAMYVYDLNIIYNMIKGNIQQKNSPRFSN